MPKYVKICPKCNSLDIQATEKNIDFSFGLPVIYQCQNCGFTNYNFPEIDVNNIEKLKKETRKIKDGQKNS
jgi:C4-type Zn-finger protein